MAATTPRPGTPSPVKSILNHCNEGALCRTPTRSRQDRLRAIRVPTIHLLAVRPVSSAYLLKQIACPEEELMDIVGRVAKPYRLDATKFDLNDRSYKELELHDFPYQKSADRDAARERAIGAFDRLRLTASDAAWQKLLPAHERGKGGCLSRLDHLQKGPIQQHTLASKIQSSADNGQRSPGRPKSSALQPGGRTNSDGSNSAITIMKKTAIQKPLKKASGSKVDSPEPAAQSSLPLPARSMEEAKRNSSHSPRSLADQTETAKSKSTQSQVAAKRVPPIASRLRSESNVSASSQQSSRADAKTTSRPRTDSHVSASLKHTRGDTKTVSSLRAESIVSNTLRSPPRARAWPISTASRPRTEDKLLATAGSAKSEHAEAEEKTIDTVTRPRPHRNRSTSRLDVRAQGKSPSIQSTTSMITPGLEPANEASSKAKKSPSGINSPVPSLRSSSLVGKKAISSRRRSSTRSELSIPISADASGIPKASVPTGNEIKDDAQFNDSNNTAGRISEKAIKIANNDHSRSENLDLSSQPASKSSVSDVIDEVVSIPPKDNAIEPSSPITDRPSRLVQPLNQDGQERSQRKAKPAALQTQTLQGQASIYTAPPTPAKIAKVAGPEVISPLSLGKRKVPEDGLADPDRKRQKPTQYSPPLSASPSPPFLENQALLLQKAQAFKALHASYADLHQKCRNARGGQEHSALAELNSMHVQLSQMKQDIHRLQASGSNC